MIVHRLLPSLLVPVLAMAAIASPPQWEQLYPSTEPDLLDVASNGGGVSIAVGNSGLLTRSVDGGVTWVDQVLPTARLNAVHHSHGSNWYAAGVGIFKSIDDGASWSLVAPSHDVEALDSVGTGVWAIGSDGLVYRSFDSGMTWATSQIPGSFLPTMYGLSFEDSSVGRAVGLSSAVFVTQDGGATWTAATPPQILTAYYRSMHNVDALGRDVLLGPNATYTTLNGGGSWSSSLFPFTTGARDIDIVDGVGLAAGVAGSIQWTQDSGANWTLSFQSSSELEGVAVNGPQEALVVGEDGLILRTTDSGGTWTVVRGGSTTSSPWIYGINALDDDTVFAACNLGTILRSDDAGVTWQEQDGGAPNSIFRAVDFYDDQVGYACGGVFSPQISYTHDGGLNWVQLTFSGMIEVHDVAALDATTAVVVGSRTYRTTNGGLGWTLLQGTPLADLYGVDFVDASRGVAVGESIQRTLDGGLTWTEVWTLSSDFYSVAYKDPDTLIAVGQAGQMLRSVDAGTTWQALSSGTTWNLRDIDYDEGRQAWWAVGDQATVLTSIDDGQTWTPAGIPGIVDERITGIITAGTHGIWLGGWEDAGVWGQSTPTVSCVAESYCQGKVHSGGLEASMIFLGDPSQSSGPVGVGIVDGLPGSAGLAFRSLAGPAQLPFFNGTLCVAAPLDRLPIQVMDSFGFTYYVVDITSAMVGSSHWYQFFFRDPQHPDGTGLAMSNGLTLTFCP